MTLTLLRRLLSFENDNSELYSPYLRRMGTATQLAAAIQRLTDVHGRLEDILHVNGRFHAVLERAIIPFSATFDDEERLSSIWIEEPAARGELSDLSARMAKLPGTTALYIETERQARVEQEADLPMAVASSFKLAVLLALERSSLSLQQMVNLRPEWKSLPSGILQDWPDGTPLTVATLANLMISESDNTATDILIHLLGRTAIEKVAPGNRPFLATREAFHLKTKHFRRERASWSDLDHRQRLELLDSLAERTAPLASDLEDEPTLTVEWYFTARELVALLVELGDNPALSINTGPASARDWAGIWFKGGSEPGALSYALCLKGHDGRRHGIAATWNSASDTVDPTTLSFLVRGMLYAL